jgi:streptomycin 6-kinase
MDLATAWNRDLAEDGGDSTLLHGDLYPSNILAAGRQPWLAIDPMPMIGDRTYDLVQFLLFRRGDLADSDLDLRLHIDRIAAWANVDPVRLASFAFVKLVFDIFLSTPGSGEIKLADLVPAQQFLAAARI